MVQDSINCIKHTCAEKKEHPSYIPWMQFLCLPLCYYINDSLFSCVFTFLHSFRFLQLSAFFLFLWNSLFHPQDILQICWLIFKTVENCLEALYMCFGICHWLWVSLQYHLTGPFFFSWENPILYIFTFSLCWLHSPGMDPWSPVHWHLEGICLAPRNSWVEGKFLTIWHIKCLLLPQLSLWNPPVTWTGSSSLYPLLYQI